MKDREFLLWVSDRLEHVHNEKPIVDYMHKFQAIIKAYPADKLRQTSDHQTIQINCEKS